jgi:predicted dehydrogenase
MKKLRAAVAGVGYLGTFHAQKYKNNQNVELVGVFDVNREQSEKVASSLGVGVFEKITDLLGKVDIVTIAASTQSHYEVAEYLLQNSIHVNVEKPMTVDSFQAARLISLAKEKNLKLTVGHIERFNPAYLKWRSMCGNSLYLEFERIGPYKGRGADVSVIHDLMIHDLDLLLSLNPGPLASLEVKGEKVLSATFDWAMVLLCFTSGLKVYFKASRVSSIGSRVIRSFEEEAHWIVNLGSGELEMLTFSAGAEIPLVSSKIVTDKVDALQCETDQFVDAVLNNRVPLIRGEDGMAALELVERIYSELNRNH